MTRTAEPVFPGLGATASEHRRTGVHERLRAIRTPRPELAVLLLLATVLHLWALGRNGFVNEYYSAAVRSMSTSWHAFLYGAFDSSGVMTVDKPPLALWIQALSVRVFGFHPLSVLVPQALMGVAAVGLVSDLVRRLFGRQAGFVAGLVLATTPIAVAVSRHNNPDALLVLCCVAALWCLVRGLQDGRTRWLVLCGVAVGLGFETKMAAALLVVPGLAAAWLWVAPRGRPAALRQLLAGGAAMAAVGLAWPVLVWLTPAASRPWVSGTSDNSIWSLIAGYNGAGRLAGQAGGPAALAGGGAGGVFGGATGPLRLLDASLGGQAGWLLGFALVAGVALLAATRLRRTDVRTGWLIATGGAFLACAVAFSYAGGIFHPYYVSLLAPWTAALVGAGAGLLVQGDRLARILAPLAVLAGVGTELVVLDRDVTTLGWAAPLVAVAGGLAAVALALPGSRRLRRTAMGVALAALLAAPATYAAQTLGHKANGTFPAGGGQAAGPGGTPGGRIPGARGGFGGPPPGARARALPGAPPGAVAPGGLPSAGAGARPGGARGGGAFGSGVSASVLRYVKTHGGGTIGVSSQQGASQAIIASGARVAGLGGFSGRESAVSVSWLARAVADGRIRWVVADRGSGPGADGRSGSREVIAAAKRAGRAVRVDSSTVVYDLQGRADALRSAGA